MNKYAKFIIIIIFLYSGLPLLIHASTEQASIPGAAQFILNKAGQLVNDDKTEAAIHLLETFKLKAKKCDEKSASRKGYTHYMVDFTLGNYYLMLSNFQKAMSCYESVIGKNENYSDAWLNLAKCYYELQQVEKAGNAFLRGYETSVQRKAVYLYYSSLSYMMANNYSQAYLVFKRLLRDYPTQIELAWKESLVHILITLERHSEALPYIEEIAKKHTGIKKKEWQEVLLSQYIFLQMDKKALLYANWLTYTDTLEPKWWKALCQLHLSKDRLRDGLTALLTYSFLTPLSNEEKALMGDLYMMLGIPSKALAYYQAVVQAESTSIETYKKISQSYIRLYDVNSALSWAEKGLSQKDDNDLLMIKGNLLYEIGKYHEATKTYEKFTHQNKISGQAFLMLGYAFWGMGDIDKARTAFKKASQYSNEKRSARQALKEIARITK